MSTNVIHLAEYDHESDMKPNRQHQDDVNLEKDDESTVGIKSKKSGRKKNIWLIFTANILTESIEQGFLVRNGSNEHQSAWKDY